MWWNTYWAKCYRKKKKGKKTTPLVGLEPTTFELEVQCASPLRHRGWLRKPSENLTLYFIFPFIWSVRPCRAIDLENTAFNKYVSQNSTYHHMPGKQNRTKFPLSTVRPSASTKLIGTPNESNQIEQNRTLMGSIFRQTKKWYLENFSGGGGGGGN